MYKARLATIFTCGIIALMPLVTHAAIPFFGPIIPESASICPGSWALVIEVINNCIQLAITLLIVLVAPIMFAYAGFTILLNPANPGARNQAKQMLLNLFGGIVLSLSAWIVVDAFMAVLYQPGRAGEAWYEIVHSGGISTCLIQEGALFQLHQVSGNITGITSDGGGGVYLDGKGAALCSDSNSVCSPSALQAAGFGPDASKVMSCIALTENSGKSSGCNGNACGTFQIMLTVNNLVGPSCAKYSPSGSSVLQCASMCHAKNGGAVANEASCQPCVRASQDAQCNAESAYALYKSSGYGPWTTSSDNTKSGACVAAYGSGA